MTARLSLVPAEPADVAALAPSVRADRLAGYLHDLGVSLARETWQPEPPTAESRRLLAALEREGYPTVAEMERERYRRSPSHCPEGGTR